MIYHFFKGNILHLSPSIIESILKNAKDTNKGGMQEHFFYISQFDSKMLYKYDINPYEEVFKRYGTEKYKYIKSKLQFIYIILSLSSNDRIFFHGSSSPYMLQLFIYSILYMFRLKKKAGIITMVSWGESDFYYHGRKYISYIVQSLFHHVFPLLRYLLTISPGDTKLAMSLYPNVNVLQVPYIPNREVIRIPRVAKTLNIMISHSGWPHNNHLHSFDLIAQFAHEDILVICPLCYGDPEYIKTVIAKGKEVFGNKFTYFPDLKPESEYTDFLRTVDVYVTTAPIQTGLFALMTVVVNGGRVYVTGNLLYSMKEYGFHINDIDEIKGMSFKEFSLKPTEEEYQHNISIYCSKYSNMSELQQKWNYVYSN